MAFKDHIDTDIFPTRKVLAGLIAAFLMPLLAQLASQVAWLAWLGNPGLVEAIPVAAFFLAAYMIRDEPKQPAPEFQGENVTRPPGSVQSSPLAALLGLMVLATLVTGCASDPGVRWAQTQTAYNDTMSTLMAMRRPCVPGAGIEGAGPDHPHCRIDDELYDKVETVRQSARLTLRLIDDAGRLNQAERLEVLLVEFEGLLVRLVSLKGEAERGFALPGL